MGTAANWPSVFGGDEIDTLLGIGPNAVDMERRGISDGSPNLHLYFLGC